MPENHSDDSSEMPIWEHLEEFRRRMLISLGIMAIFMACLWSQGQNLMKLVRAPLDRYAGHLIYIDPAEAFNAYLKVVVVTAFLMAFPFLLYQVWAFLAPAFPKTSRRRILIWLSAIFLFFIAGILFAYEVMIPAALGFLLNFGSNMASAMITLERYLGFFVVLILAGGFVFEIPLAIAFLADLGLIQAKLLRKQRPAAIVLILIVAAVITPTQDAFNMLLLAVPIFLLYESGIALAAILEKKHYRKES